MARESIVDRDKLESCLSAVIFLGLFLYIWKGIEPPLLYYGFGVFATYPIVSLEGSFLRTTFSSPGGPLNALAALLAQSYAYAWLGALVITALLGVLLLGIRRLLRSVQAAKFRDLAWVPLLLVLAIYSCYYENPLPVLLAVGLSVWTAVLYAALPGRTLPRRVGLFAVLFAVVYYLVGATALVFASITCLTEALLHRRIRPAVASSITCRSGLSVS